MNAKVRRLPDSFRRWRRTFWTLYLGTMIGIPMLTILIVVSLMGVEELVKEMTDITPLYFSMYVSIMLIYSVPFLGFYLGMRSSQKQCLEKYNEMPEPEKRQIDYGFSQRMGMGDIIYTQSGFMHRDKWRFFFPYIHTYREVVWAYLAQSVYQNTEVSPVIFLKEMKFQTIVVQVADGRKYRILMGDGRGFQKHLSADTVIGYGSEQKRQAKERRWKYEGLDPTLSLKRRADRRKFIVTTMAFVVVLALSISAMAYFE
ncbi:MAG: hypothetical protein J1F02_05925 [Lachnospiraceae bacterium]|nr:hypothetical protein [Lachnospiraceae bacterium]